MTKPTRKRAIQNAWVVNDIEAAAIQWSETLNIGPFFLGHYTNSMFESLEYRGSEGTLDMTTAIAFSGDMQIELIEPSGPAPSAYRDIYAPGESGFHHLCFWSDDIDADLAHYASLGCEAANVGKLRNGPRFAYVDAWERSGCMIELLEYVEPLAKLFDTWREANQSWDGEDPIVRL